MSCCNIINKRPGTHDLEKRICAQDKRLINCRTVDVNQLMPLKYQWAWEHYLNGCANHYVIMEGIFFYSGFVMMLSFHRQNRMTGVGEQFQYILRDETIHLNFGIDLINGISSENPEIWTTQFQRALEDLIEQAVALEVVYAGECLPRGILGLNRSLFREYVQHIADRRLERIGLHARYGSKNPFPWMSETIDLGKEKNFFETRVTEYQAGGLLAW